MKIEITDRTSINWIVSCILPNGERKSSSFRSLEDARDCADICEFRKYTDIKLELLLES